MNLGVDEVHVWVASLDPPEHALGPFAGQLSDAERARAARFCFAADRRRFVAGRGLLRTILGRYLDTEPARVELDRSPQGKPELQPSSSRGIRFNCSHSGDLVVCAIASGRRVGIDVERVRPVPRLLEIAAAVLTTAEYLSFRRLSEHRRVETFFRCWTCKEAYLKACGAGLAGNGPLGVSLAAGPPLRLESVEGGVREAARWSLEQLVPAEDFAGAVAVEGHDWRLTCRWWPPA